jgi:hypothetical protein
MSLAGVDLNQIRALDALLAEGSVTGAARRLGVTQAAASNAPRRPREQTGDALLVRAGRRMVLTPRGAALAAPAAEAMRAAARLLEPERPFDPARSRDAFRAATFDHVDLVLFPHNAATAAARAAARAPSPALAPQRRTRRAPRVLSRRAAARGRLPRAAVSPRAAGAGPYGAAPRGASPAASAFGAAARAPKRGRGSRKTR